MKQKNPLSAAEVRAIDAELDGYPDPIEDVMNDPYFQRILLMTKKQLLQEWKWMHYGPFPPEKRDELFEAMLDIHEARFPRSDAGVEK